MFFLDIVKPIPDWGRIFPMAANGFRGGGFNAFDGLLASSAQSAMGGILNPVSDKLSSSTTAKATAEVTVRKLFPESWLWSELTSTG